MTEPEEKKPNTEQAPQELKLFVFTVQGGPMLIEIAEDLKIVMALDEQAAFNMVRRDYPLGSIISVKKRGQLELKKIADALLGMNVNVPTSVEVDDRKTTITGPLGTLPSEAVQLPSTPEKTVQDFIYGMMLIADKFVEDKRDRASLKRIINKIKIYDEKTNPSQDQK